MSKRSFEDESDPEQNNTAVDAAKLSTVEIESQTQPKLTRLETQEYHGATDTTLTCSLPPLCNARPRTFHDLSSFESHYKKYHCTICNECQARFPTDIFLNLHLEECHDPIWSSRLARGEKTYRCFVEYCPVKFASATSRRRHLESEHQYPSEFRFNLVTKGLDKNAKSLLYDHKARKVIQKNLQVSASDERSIEAKDAPPLNRLQRRAALRAAQSGNTEDDCDTKTQHEHHQREDGTSHDQASKRKQPIDAKELHKQSLRDLFKKFEDPDSLEPSTDNQSDSQMDDLSSVMAQSMLVPPHVKFGSRGTR